MDFKYTEEEDRFREKLVVFLDEHLTEEIARQNWEELGVGPEGRAFSKLLAENGFLGMSWPEEYGGQGLSPSYEFILLDELGKRGAHVPLDIGYTMVGPTILRRGSDEMKKEFLPRIVAGEIEFGLGYTEPNAGSDLAAMEMSVVEDGNDFIINGQKTFNTECHYAEYHWLAAKTISSPDVSPYKSISLFIVDMDSPGITTRPLWAMSGERTNEVFYDNVRVPKNRLVGDLNLGFYYMMEALGSERNHVSIPSRVGYILNKLVDYAKETRYDGEPLAQNPIVQSQLAQVTMDLEVVTVLAEYSRWMEMNEMIMTWQPEITKLMQAELLQRLVDAGMQILGSFCQLKEGSLWAPLKGMFESQYGHAFVGTIGAGTSEINRNVIAQRGLGLPRK